MARKTKQEFIEEAQQVHGDRFDYSEVEYVNTHTPVKIMCGQCGLVFSCPKCSKKKTHKIIDQEVFIARAKEVHGDKYDYSKTEYKDMHSKVHIICPRHGDFYQRAQSHILGNGCPLCKRDKQIERMKVMMERVIK